MDGVDAVTQRMLERARQRGLELNLSSIDARTPDANNENLAPVDTTMTKASPRGGQPPCACDSPSKQPGASRRESLYPHEQLEAIRKDSLNDSPITPTPDHSYLTAQTRPSVLFSPGHEHGTSPNTTATSPQKPVRANAPSPGTTISALKTNVSAEASATVTVSCVSRQLRFASPLAACTINDEITSTSSSRNENAEETNEQALSPVVTGYGNDEVQRFADETTQDDDSSEECGINAFVQKSPSSTITPTLDTVVEAAIAISLAPSSSPDSLEATEKEGASCHVPAPLPPSSPFLEHLHTAPPSTPIAYKPASHCVSPIVGGTSITRSASHRVVESEHRPFRRGSDDVIDQLKAAAEAATVPHRTQRICTSQRANPIFPIAVTKTSCFVTPINSTTQNAGNLQRLRERWEVSSSTGTPLHPDQGEAELLAAAQRMSSSSTASSPRRTPRRPVSYHAAQSSNNVNSPARREEIGREPKRQHRSNAELASIDDDYGSAGSESIDGGMRSPSATTAYPKSPVAVAFSQSKLLASGQSKRSLHRKSEDGEETRTTCEDDSDGDEHADDDQSKQGKSATPKKQAEDSPAVTDQLIDEVFDFMQHQQSSSPAVNRVDSEDSTHDDGLLHSVSFYRKRQRQGQAAVASAMRSSPRMKDARLDDAARRSDDAKYEETFKRIASAIAVQQKQIEQASHALAYCRATQEFRGSREEVDAQRALLISTARRRALIFEQDRLKQRRANRLAPIGDGPRGTLTISNITVNLARDFVNGHINYGSDLLFYFIVLIREGERVQHTQMVTSDEGMQSGYLQFQHYMQLSGLLPDFSVTLEIFGLRTRREMLSHADKYRLKGATMKKSGRMINPTYGSPGGPAAVIDPSFQCLGRLVLDLATVARNKFSLVEVVHPIDGGVRMDLRSFADNAGEVVHKAFLSLHQEVQGLGSWTRFWCRLAEGRMCFWRYPDDEPTKVPTVAFDLSRCVKREINAVPREECARPFSIEVDVWDPDSTRDKIRLLMSADSKPDMEAWLCAINDTLRNLVIWNPHPRR